MAAAKKNIWYELNINLNYHIGSDIMTKLNRLQLYPVVDEKDEKENSSGAYRCSDAERIKAISGCHERLIEGIYTYSDDV